MGRNASVILVISIMMCFAINSTFPLHREKKDKSNSKVKDQHFQNASKESKMPVHTMPSKESKMPVHTMPSKESKMPVHTMPSKESKMPVHSMPSKKMTLNSALQKIKESTQDFGKNIYSQVNKIKNPVSEDNLRHYKELILKKKYPFVDLEEYEPKFRPSNKNVRHSMLASDHNSYRNNAGFCQLMDDDGPNVEITNRGLSGFSMPNPDQPSERKMNENLAADVKLMQIQEHSALGSLRNKVLEYVEQKNNKD